MRASRELKSLDRLVVPKSVLRICLFVCLFVYLFVCLLDKIPLNNNFEQTQLLFSPFEKKKKPDQMTNQKQLFPNGSAWEDYHPKNQQFPHTLHIFSLVLTGKKKKKKKN